MTPYLLALIMTFISSFGGYFLKKASNAHGVKALLGCKFLWLGGLFYVLSSIFNIWLLRIVDYSVAVPLGAMTYVWSFFIAKKLLGEKITRRRVLGIVLIISGVILIAL